MTKILEVETGKSAEDASRRARFKKVAALVSAALALTFVAWGRLPTLTRETVWAEDGGVFLRDIIRSGHLQSIFLPYDGYLHVLPRLLASSAHVLLPLDFYAVAMSLSSCAVVAVISVGVFCMSKTVSDSVVVRSAIAVIPVLLPIGPHEVLGNAANLHWYLLWLAPWLLIYKTKSPATSAGVFIVAFITATSEIITGMFLPLAVWTAFRRRNFAAPAGLFLGVLLQGLTTLANPRFNGAAPTAAVDPLSVVSGYVLLPIGSNWYPDSRTLSSGIVNFGALSLVIPAVLITGVFVYVLVKGNGKLRAAAVVAVAASWVCWTASVVLSGNPMFNYASYSEVDWASAFGYIRYAAAPAMFLLILIPLAAAVAMKDGHIGRRAAPLLVGTFITFLLIAYFPAATMRQVGPSWTPGVEAARLACTNDPALVHAGVTIAPATWKYAQVDIPCAELRGS